MVIHINQFLTEQVGAGSIITAGILIGMTLLMILVIVFLILNLIKTGKLSKRLDKFLQGKEGKSLEQDIIGLFEDNTFLKISAEKNRNDIKELFQKMEGAYQKAGLVKYDAFQQMGGSLSFCLCLLDEKNNGFLMNSVHSTEGCYTYTKEIKAGESDVLLGEEEKKALNMAMKKISV